MRDVAYVLHKGSYRFKALTQAAKDAMGKEVGGPWQMASDIFWAGVHPDKFSATIDKLHGYGLQTEDDPVEVDTSQFTDF